MSTTKRACLFMTLNTHALRFCIAVNCSFGNQWQRGLSVTCLRINNELFICNTDPGRYNLGDNLHELTALFCNRYVGNKLNKWHTVLILM